MVNQPPYGQQPSWGQPPSGPPAVPQQSWGPLPPPPTSPTPFHDSGNPSGGAALAILGLVGGWATLLAVIGQGAAWGYDQTLQGEESTLAWLLSAALLGALTGLPAALYWRFGKHPVAKTVARSWTFVALAVLVLSPVRFLSASSTVLSTLILSAALAAFALVLSRLPSFSSPRTTGDGGTLVALAAGLFTLVPWAVNGALGGLVDIVLGVALAAAYGWFAAVVLAPVWREGTKTWSRVKTSLIGGSAAAVVLVVLVAGASPRAISLWLAVCVPAVGFVCAAACHAAPRRLPTFAAVLPAAVGPLLFLDPDEADVALLLAEVGRVAVVTLALGLLTSVLAGGGLTALAGVLRSRKIAAGVAALALVVAGGAYAIGGQHSLTGDRVFVVMKSQAKLGATDPGTDLTERRQETYDRLVDHAKRTQAPLREALDRLGVDYTPYYLVNAIEIDAGSELRPWLASRDDVSKVLDSPRLRPVKQPNEPQTGRTGSPPGAPDWNLGMVRAPETWEKFHATGKGVVVGQSDSGVEGDHPALADSYRGAGGKDDYNWIDPWNGTKSPTDTDGHGTHTLGTAVGKYVGVAPGAKWIGCSNLARNLADPAYYLNCMQFMLAPYPQQGDPFTDGDPRRAADVMNNSWGCPPSEGCDPGALEPGVRALTHAGIFVVSSAGNSGPKCSSVSDPIAIYSDALSVGAVDSQRKVASFSSRGPVTVDGSRRIKPDIAAPGVEIRSALPGGTYGNLNGTSMAGPHVAGAVALLWSANPKLKGDVTATAKILRDTARKAASGKGTSSCGNERNAVGAGILDTYAAVAAAEKLGK